MIGIAAVSANNVIGANGKIPWHLPEDFKWFKFITMGHALVMGRKTYESIGRPLPGRTTYILTRSGYTATGAHTVADLSEIKLDEGKMLFLCGGGELYRQYLPECSSLYITHVKKTCDGDVLFPDLVGFVPNKTMMDNSDFSVVKYTKKT